MNTKKGNIETVAVNHNITYGARSPVGNCTEMPRYVSSEELTSKAPTKIFKPIQYLGAKHRPLPIILERAIKLIDDGYVLDLFSGSSVVSQTFNVHGMKVIANDALQFNSVFAKTLLNVKRKEKDLIGLKVALVALEKFRLKKNLTAPFDEAIEIEADLLKKRKTDKLLQLYKNFPQVGKVFFMNGSNKHVQTKFILNNIGKDAFQNAPLIANYYASSYFGIKQALELDRLRNGIESLKRAKEISDWQYNFLLTCLMNVASKVVFTAGKHFAQPIKKENVRSVAVLNKRMYDDRSKNVWEEFVKAFESLMQSTISNFNSRENLVFSTTMENLLNEVKHLPKVSLIYADPPYTAQQYSRYYHVPEVIYKYQYPKLQVVDSSVTSGLYPEDKFKSRFCSKRDAVSAFADLFKLTKELNSNLIISYSASLSAETGNSRMIELEQILELGRSYLRSYGAEVIKFEFAYRQLNASSKIIQSKDDKEFLIVFKRTRK